MTSATGTHSSARYRGAKPCKAMRVAPACSANSSTQKVGAMTGPT